jgi:hypothetical protein
MKKIWKDFADFVFEARVYLLFMLVLSIITAIVLEYTWTRLIINIFASWTVFVVVYKVMNIFSSRLVVKQSGVVKDLDYVKNVWGGKKNEARIILQTNGDFHFGGVDYGVADIVAFDESGDYSFYGFIYQGRPALIVMNHEINYLAVFLKSPRIHDRLIALATREGYKHTGILNVPTAIELLERKTSHKMLTVFGNKSPMIIGPDFSVVIDEFNFSYGFEKI